MDPTIDPGERAAWALLSGRDGTTIAETIATMAKSLVEGRLTGPAVPRLRPWQKLADEATTAFDEVEALRLMPHLPPGDELATLHVLRNAHDVRAQACPHSSYTTVAGQHPLQPSLQSRADYSKLLQMLDDVVDFVLRSMADGSLMTAQVQVAASVVPTIVQAIDTATRDAIDARVAKDRGWMLPRDVERGVKALRGIPVQGPIPAPTVQAGPQQGKGPEVEPAADVETPSEQLDSTT